MKRLTSLLVLSCCTLIFGQDRLFDMQYNLPNSVLNSTSGKVIDITAPPFNAQGDGISDDTPAFIAAYDSLMSAIDGVQNSDPEVSHVIYIPDGTYRITNTIIYSTIYMNDSLLDPKPGIDDEVIAPLRFIGQSRVNTVLKLDDGAAGYEAGNQKALLSFGRSTFNNLEARNCVRNLTIDVGSNNPGAIGIKMGGANNASMQNVTIKSSDSQALCGIDFTIGTVVGYYRDITIDGFDYGVRCVPHHFTDPVMEYVSMTNISKCGIYVEKGCGTFRKISFNGNGAALKIMNSDGHVVLLDSEVTGSASDTAFVIDSGRVLLRNVELVGFGEDVWDGSSSVSFDESIDFYVNDEVYYFPGSENCMLNLPISEVPDQEWSNDFVNTWKIAEDYGVVGDGITDDRDALQALFDSGTEFIFLANQDYKISGPVAIPPFVKRIAGFYGEIGGLGNKFIIEGNATDPPLIIEDLYFSGGTAIDHSSQRTLILSNVGTQDNLYLNSENNQKTVYINACNGLKTSGPIVNQEAFIRFVNTEAPTSSGQFLIDNSQVVCMGFKTEKGHTAFTVQNQSKFELLGGVANQFPLADPSWQQDTVSMTITSFEPIVNVVDSEVALSLATTGPTSNQGFMFVVKDSTTANTLYIQYDSLPARLERIHNNILPLYVHQSQLCDLGWDEQQSGVDVKSFPNPFSSDIQFNWQASSSIAELTLFDIQGKIILHSWIGKNETIPLKQLQDGVYIYQILIDQERYNGRLVKQ